MQTRKTGYRCEDNPEDIKKCLNCKQNDCTNCLTNTSTYVKKTSRTYRKHRPIQLIDVERNELVATYVDSWEASEVEGVPKDTAYRRAQHRCIIDGYKWRFG